MRPSSKKATRRSNPGKRDRMLAGRLRRKPGLRCSVIKRFRAKACPGPDPGWMPVRVKKTRQTEIRGLFGSDSIRTEQALACGLIRFRGAVRCAAAQCARHSASAAGKLNAEQRNRPRLPVARTGRRTMASSNAPRTTCHHNLCPFWRSASVKRVRRSSAALRIASWPTWLLCCVSAGDFSSNFCPTG